MKTIISVISMLALVICVCQATVIHVPGDQPTIQAGIDAAAHGDTVLVADGVYTGDGNRSIDTGGKELVIISENGSGHCIVDCQQNRYGFHVNESTRPLVIQGFTITGAGDGGLIIDQAIVRIVDCKILANRSQFGGGVSVENSTAQFVDCCIQDNQAFTEENQRTDGLGGGIFICGGEITFTNCLITGNICDYYGAAAYITETDPVFQSCTFANNDYGMGGLFLYESCPVFTDCIVWDYFETMFSAPSATYSNLFDDFAGEGNIYTDPLFVSGPGGEYYLSHSSAGQTGTSPCVDAGSQPASEVCFDTMENTICLDSMTTRTDQINDVDTVDMGYHYTLTGDCTIPGIDLVMSTHMFEPYEPVLVEAMICNPGPEQIDAARVYIVLFVYDQLFFWPTWSTAIDYSSWDLPVLSCDRLTFLQPRGGHYERSKTV